MKRSFLQYLFLLGLLVLSLTACQEKPKEDPVTVIKIGETTPSLSATATPTAAATNTPTPVPTNTSTPSPAITAPETISPTPPFPSPAEERKDFLSLLNAYRKDEGAAAVVSDETLTLLAGVRLAEVSVTGLSHVRPNGEEYDSLLPTYHAKAAAVCEFVFSLSGVTEEKAFAAFAESKEHASEMLRDYTHMGFAADGTYVVVLFAKDFLADD